jgi:hypothetical protein
VAEAGRIGGINVIKVEVIGVEKVQAKLRAVPARFHAELYPVVSRLTIELQRDIRQNHHDDGGLNLARGGPGSDGVHESVSDNGREIRGSVGSNTWYVREWEMRGFPAYDIVPVKARALFWPGAQHPVRRVSKPAQPPRPTFRPALQAIHERTVDEIGKAIERAIHGAV